MNLYAKAGSNPGLAFSPKGGVPPTQKIEPHKTKNRLRALEFEIREGGRLKKYEKDLQKKTSLKEKEARPKLSPVCPCVRF